MSLNDTALIALAICAIIFPTFVIIPSAFAIFKRIADRWFTAAYSIAFGIASLSLLLATLYTAPALFSDCSALSCSLGVLFIILTMAVIYFLRKLQQWLLELAILEIISDAEAKEP